MRMKLQILREGRIPSDAELVPLLLDTNPSSATPGVETSVPPEDEEIPEEEEEDGEEVEGEVEGENMLGDKPLEAQVDLLMQNLLQQSEAHQSIPRPDYLRVVLTKVVVGQSTSTEGPKGTKEDAEFENIYGDEDEE
jgi:hypothetical protein